MDFLLEMYRQCNEHLRHTDSKRDQLLAFYAAIVALFFNAFDELTGNNVMVETSTLVAVVGILLSLVIIHYRRWHIVYNRSAIILQNLAVKRIPLTRDAACKEWDELQPRPPKTWGVEFLVFNSFLVVTSAPTYIAVNSFMSAVSWWSCVPWVIRLVMTAGVYIAILNVVSCAWLRDTSLQGVCQSWLLSFLPRAQASGPPGPPACPAA